jgi:hypothetical protein
MPTLNSEVAGVQFHFRSTLSGAMPSRKRTQSLSFLFSLTLLVFLTACDSSPSGMDEAPSTDSAADLIADEGGAAVTCQFGRPNEGNTGTGATPSKVDSFQSTRLG